MTVRRGNKDFDPARRRGERDDQDRSNDDS